MGSHWVGWELWGSGYPWGRGCGAGVSDGMRRGGLGLPHGMGAVGLGIPWGLGALQSPRDPALPDTRFFGGGECGFTAPTHPPTRCSRDQSAQSLQCNPGALPELLRIKHPKAASCPMCSPETPW